MALTQLDFGPTGITHVRTNDNPCFTPPLSMPGSLLLPLQVHTSIGLPLTGQVSGNLHGQQNPMEMLACFDNNSHASYHTLIGAKMARNSYPLCRGSTGITSIPLSTSYDTSSPQLAHASLVLQESQNGQNTAPTDSVMMMVAPSTPRCPDDFIQAFKYGSCATSTVVRQTGNYMPSSGTYLAPSLPSPSALVVN